MRVVSCVAEYLWLLSSRCSACALHHLLFPCTTHVPWFHPSIVTVLPTVSLICIVVCMLKAVMPLCEGSINQKLHWQWGLNPIWLSQAPVVVCRDMYTKQDPFSDLAVVRLHILCTGRIQLRYTGRLARAGLLIG